MACGRRDRRRRSGPSSQDSELWRGACWHLSLLSEDESCCPRAEIRGPEYLVDLKEREQGTTTGRNDRLGIVFPCKIDRVYGIWCIGSVAYIASAEMNHSRQDERWQEHAQPV